MSIRLKPEITVEIKKNSSLRLKIQAAIGASHNTIMKYLDDNDGRLTQLDSVNIITEHMSMPLSEVITGEKLSKLMSR